MLCLPQKAGAFCLPDPQKAGLRNCPYVHCPSLGLARCVREWCCMWRTGGRTAAPCRQVLDLRACGNSKARSTY